MAFVLLCESSLHLVATLLLMSCFGNLERELSPGTPQQHQQHHHENVSRIEDVSCMNALPGQALDMQRRHNGDCCTETASKQRSGEIMFRCQLCSSVVPAGTRSSKIILVTRNKTYDERGSNPAGRGGFARRGRTPAPKKNFDKGGEGEEIVREVTVCPQCAEHHQRQVDQETSNTNEGAE